MRFGSTAKVLAKCMLKYYRISECEGTRKRQCKWNVVLESHEEGSHTSRHTPVLKESDQSITRKLHSPAREGTRAGMSRHRLGEQFVRWPSTALHLRQYGPIFFQPICTIQESMRHTERNSPEADCRA